MKEYLPLRLTIKIRTKIDMISNARLVAKIFQLSGNLEDTQANLTQVRAAIITI